MSKKYRKRNFTDSLNDALNGIISSIVEERNIKIDFVVAILVFLASIFFSVSRVEMLLICIVIGAVIGFEMMNTSIENTVDLIKTDYDPKVKKIKDTSAGAVLIVVISAIIIGYGVFIDKINYAIETSMDFLINLPLHISFATLMVVIISVIFIKAITKTGTPLKGGMPSGHAAIASSVVIIIWYFTSNVVVLLMSIVLMILVIHSRVEAQIHTFKESVLGVVCGSLITSIIFALCKYFGIV